MSTPISPDPERYMHNTKYLSSPIEVAGTVLMVTSIQMPVGSSLMDRTGHTAGLPGSKIILLFRCWPLSQHQFLTEPQDHRKIGYKRDFKRSSSPAPNSNKGHHVLNADICLPNLNLKCSNHGDSNTSRGILFQCSIIPS